MSPEAERRVVKIRWGYGDKCVYYSDGLRETFFACDHEPAMQAAKLERLDSALSTLLEVAANG